MTKPGDSYDRAQICARSIGVAFDRARSVPVGGQLILEIPKPGFFRNNTIDALLSACWLVWWRSPVLHRVTETTLTVYRRSSTL